MDHISSGHLDMEVFHSGDSAIGAERAFRMAMFVSGIRCLVAYIILPFVVPLLGLASGVGPWLGVVIGPLAILANGFSIRQFSRSRHRLRNVVISVNVVVIGFLLVLLGIDLAAGLSI